MPLMTFGQIQNGQYDAEINLEGQEEGLIENIRAITQNQDFLGICRWDNNTLIYKSETLLPNQIDPNKRKLFFILGNPATHSIENGMFYYSDRNGRRHNFWGKLAKNCLLKNFQSTRKEEAYERRELILSWNTNHRFVIGFTVFYSLPTPTGIQGNFYCDAQGVERLFGPILERVKAEEYSRITGPCAPTGSFANDAVLIARTQSAFNYLNQRHNGTVKLWPIRGAGSGWEGLRNILSNL